MTGRVAVEFTLPQATMKRLIEAQFSMAHQDVRYYLNGMLFESRRYLRTVATDDHRLAVCSMPIGQSLPSHSGDRTA